MAQMAARACQWLGVAMVTMSIVLVVDDLADVLLVLGRLALGLLDGLHGPADDGLVGVADGGDDAVVLAGEAADVVHAPAVDADDGHVQLIVGVALLGLGRL